MPTYVVRVWMPDRPGALGAVASRIGSVRGDVVGIDILERGAGRAVDELVVTLPDDDLVPLLVREMTQVDGVDVEDVRPAADHLSDPRLDALETAAVLVTRPTTEELYETLVERAREDFEADWVVLADETGEGAPVASGDAPAPAWVTAFLAGSRSSSRVAAGESGPDDVAVARLAAAGSALVLGRAGRPLRARERRQLAALARIVDARHVELAFRRSRLLHPSGC